jgi:hypothetical protein
MGKEELLKEVFAAARKFEPVLKCNCIEAVRSYAREPESDNTKNQLRRAATTLAMDEACRSLEESVIGSIHKHWPKEGK